MKTYFGPDIVVRLSDETLETMDKYRHAKVEAGGILLGRVFESHVLVEVATEPTRADRRGRFSFTRSRDSAQQRVNGAWNTSDGELIYLGEWHSHPEDAAKPSGRDQEMIANNLREAKMEIEFLLLVVVGRQEDWVGLRRAGLLARLDAVK
jgi:integrative and conjugative element protein (TIGR02256 family)